MNRRDDGLAVWRKRFPPELVHDGPPLTPEEAKQKEVYWDAYWAEIGRVPWRLR